MSQPRAESKLRAREIKEWKPKTIERACTAKRYSEDFIGTWVCRKKENKETASKPALTSITWSSPCLNSESDWWFIGTSSYVGCRHDGRISVCYRESRFKWKARWRKCWQQHDRRLDTSIARTTSRVMPMNLERRSARWHGWVVDRMPTSFLISSLVCLNRL